MARINGRDQHYTFISDELNLLDELNNKDLSLKRKFSLQEYNDKCNKLNTIFLKRLKKMFFS